MKMSHPAATMDAEALQQRYALLCESTRPEPDERTLPYGVEQGLQGLDRLLHHDLRALARKGAPDDFTDLYQALEHELERLREFCAFPALADKFVVAFGGGFSAGKSSLINALLGRKLLVTEVDPTTSLPTYLMHGVSNEVNALNLYGHRIQLTEAEFLSLTHDEAQLHGSYISRLLRAAFITRSEFPWPKMALIDTPGYSKDGEGTHSERTDEHLARTQLNTAQAIVWVVDARQGCITEDDLNFLSTLNRDIPLFVAISRADQKPDADVPLIQQVIASALQQRGIATLGITAVSARKPRAWPLAELKAQLQNWSQQERQLRFVENFQAQFARYDQFLADQQAHAQDELTRLNRVLTLSESRTAQSEAEHLKQSAQSRLQSLKDQGHALQAQWHAFGARLQGLGGQLGMVLPHPGAIRVAKQQRSETSALADVTFPTAGPLDDEIDAVRQSAQGILASDALGLGFGLGWILESVRGLNSETKSKLDQSNFWGVETEAPRPGTVLCDGDGLPELLWLPGGSFQMGDENGSYAERPVRTVHIQGFAIGKYPVTQGQWKKVMGSNPSLYTDGGDQCPVDSVSWNDAQEFIQTLNQQTGHIYRLPSEAEWEYACRAGNTGQWCFGNDESQLTHYAWYSGYSTRPVGGKKANAFGLYDMHGNVGEWCEDTWHDDYQGAPSDGLAWVDEEGWRVMRGGSYYSYSGRDTRAASRVKKSPGVGHFFHGLRLARTAP